MEKESVNKIELMDRYMVSVYKWTLLSAILGLLWTCFAILILEKVHLSIAGFAVFFIPPTVAIIKHKKALPGGSGRRLVVYLASIAGLIILLSGVQAVSKIFNMKLLGGTLTVIVVIAFSVYWVIRKIKIWKKYKKENIIDERTAEINKKAVNIGFYIFAGICITSFILWTNLSSQASHGFIRFNKVYITVIFLNIIYVMIAVRSMVFLYMHKKDANN